MEALRRIFLFTGALPNLPPRDNVAPTQLVPIVRCARGNGERELAQVRWGLTPFWAKHATIGAKMIDARAEGMAEKPALRAALKSRRCLVPADGLWEWQANPGRKVPWRITLEDAEPFAFAGLWERWDKAPDDVPVESCTIVTTAANRLLRPIHDRMPVIIDPADRDASLGALVPPAGPLRPHSWEGMDAYPVGT